VEPGSWESALIDALFAHAPVGLAVLDADLKYVRVNQILADINGVPMDSHIGRTPAEVIPEFAGAVEPVLRSIIDGGDPVIRVEAPRAMPDGQDPDHFYELSFYPIERDGTRIGVLGIVNDITERVMAEEEIKAQAATVYKEVVQNLTVAQMALEKGDQSRVASALERAFTSAKHLVSAVLLRRSDRDG
jgi:PAS domain S-box-containing protein